MSKTERKKTRFIRASEWHNYHPWPSKSGMRHLIFFAKQFGFDKVIKRIGRTVLIDERAFFDWVEESSQKEKRHV